MRSLRGWVLLGAALAPVPARAERIPYFARRYGVTCARCHVAPPKLNGFGEEFVARWYAAPGLAPRPTWPFAVWFTGRSEALPDRSGLRTYVNRLEIISGGRLVAPWLSYFAEWRTVSLETRGDGSLRDRSGRFEDLFATAAKGPAALTVGQFRLVSQVDVSRRVGLSEPLLLAAGVPGTGTGSLRDVALRGFAPAGRSPAVRAAWSGHLGRAWRWTTSAAVPLPGEISIPLTREARREASFELQTDPKGVVVESFAQRGLLSVGGHVFYDHGDRFLANALAAGNAGTLYWTAGAGVARAGSVTRGRWSLEGEVFPSRHAGVGARVEDRAGDGLPAALLTYLNAHFPGTRYTLRLTLEQRIQRDRHTTLLELGTVF